MEGQPSEQSNSQDHRPAVEIDPADMIERWRRESRTHFPTVTIKALSSAVVFSIVLLTLSRALDNPAFLWLGLTGLGISAGCFVLGLLGLCAGIGHDGLSAVQRAILEQIGGLQDPRAIGPLLRMLQAEEPLHRTVLNVLTRLLTSAAAEEAASLIDPHREELYKLLNHTMMTDHPELGAAILRLLPLLADRDALVCTARYIWCSAPTYNQQVAREAAHAALALLLERVDLGGPAALADWIRRLPLNLKDPPMWESVLLPHLALMQLLPHCTPEQFLRISSRDRQRLYTNLRTFMMPRLKSDYAVVVLDMVRRAADVEALSAVRDLIDGLHCTPYPRIRRAARECLPILQAEGERQQVIKTLLRGASAPDAAPETLLRAASGGGETDPQLLLCANVHLDESDPGTDESVLSAHRSQLRVKTTQAGETEQDATVRLFGRK